jgi:hypothetical protein
MSANSECDFVFFEGMIDFGEGICYNAIMDNPKKQSCRLQIAAATFLQKKMRKNERNPKD